MDKTWAFYEKFGVTLEMPGMPFFKSETSAWFPEFCRIG
jgi:hypothetical protein